MYRGLASHVIIVALVDIQHFLLLKVLASTRLNFHSIAKFDGITDLPPCRYKVVTIMLIILTQTVGAQYVDYSIHCILVD